MIHTVKVTKFGQCRVCTRKVSAGQTITFTYEDEEYKCHHR